MISGKVESMQVIGALQSIPDGEKPAAYYPASAGTSLPLSGHGLTVEASPPANLGYNSETQAVPAGLISGLIFNS